MINTSQTGGINKMIYTSKQLQIAIAYMIAVNSPVFNDAYVQQLHSKLVSAFTRNKKIAGLTLKRTDWQRMDALTAMLNTAGKEIFNSVYADAYNNGILDGRLQYSNELLAEYSHVTY